MKPTGLILAGGASRRFGGSKPLTILGGRPMIRWVGDMLATRCDELIVSIGATDPLQRFQEAVPAARLVRDGRPDCGPIEGMRRGFAAARGDFVIVAPSDAPLLRPALYDGLIAILGDHEAAVPRHDAIDPVRAVYRRDAVEHVLADERIPSPSALVDRLDAVFLEGDALQAADPALASFVDVNRREDLEQVVQLARVGR